MNQLENDIKNKQYNNFYLLYGEEDYLKTRYANLLIESVVENKDSMNYSYFDEKDINSAQIVDLAVTMPFFADKRIIHIKNSGWFKSANSDFNEYVEEPCDTCIFLFVESDIDKRSKAFKKISSDGCVLELSKPGEQDIAKWIGSKLKADRKTMERAAFQEFLVRTDNNMENMIREYEKLVSYVGEEEKITVAHVNEICTKQLQSKVFDMINGIAEKNPRKVLDLYHDMLASKEPPIKILILIQRQFRRTIQIKDLRENGLSEDRIAKDLKLANFIVRKELNMSRSFTTSTMNALLEDACDLEADIKSGQIKDQLAVELLMLKYSK